MLYTYIQIAGIQRITKKGLQETQAWCTIIIQGRNQVGDAWGRTPLPFAKTLHEIT